MILVGCEKCRTCHGSGLKRGQKPCGCTKPCSKCGGTVRDRTAECSACRLKNAKRHRQKLLTTGVACSKCGVVDRYRSGQCRVCAKRRRIDDWAACAVLVASKNARRRGHALVEITPGWVLEQFNKQEGRCFYTNLLLDIEAIGTRSHFQPSLDRVDNTLTYTCENTRLTSLGWNQLRNESSIKDTLSFLTQCRLTT